MFGKFYPQDARRNTEALQSLESMIRPVPDLDYEQELAAYREVSPCKPRKENCYEYKRNDLQYD